MKILWDQFLSDPSTRSRVIEAVKILREAQFFNILKSYVTVDSIVYMVHEKPAEIASLLASENAGAMKVIDLLENIDKYLDVKKDRPVELDFGAPRLAFEKGLITKEDYEQLKRPK